MSNLELWEKVITTALEGGWNPEAYPDKKSSRVLTGEITAGHPDWQTCLHNVATFIRDEWGVYRILATPAFWQSLGVALGWKTIETSSTIDRQWEEKWVEFIRHLAGRGDAESFLASLLPHSLEGRGKQELQ